MKNQKQNINSKNRTDLKMGLTKKQRSWVYTGFFIGVILLMFVINNSGSEPEQGPYPPNYVPAVQKSSVKAADFSLPTTDGKTLKLSDLKGKVVILDFWATWCPPCRKGIPDLIDLKKRYGSKGLEVVGISVDQETKPDVVPFVKDYGINYPVVYGDNGVVMNYGGIRSIPTTFVVDREGKIVANYVGLYPKKTYEDQIKKLL
ncbi:MAG: TlpA disulfide reductase family protein [Bacteroidota bacterium]